MVRTHDTVLAIAVVLLASGCLDVDTRFCGDLVCGQGLVCNIDGERCVPPEQKRCGDGFIDDNEACDDGGDAADWCSDDCRSDYSCGNGIVDRDQGEECDCGWNPDIAAQSWVAAECNGQANGAEGSHCNNKCVTLCGDGVIEAGEMCDSNNMGGQTCTDFGFDIGALQCSRCVVDTRTCDRIGWYRDRGAPADSRRLRALWGMELSGDPNDANDANDAQSALTHVFAVGDKGLMMHHDGVSWRVLPTPNPAIDLDVVWGTAPDQVYAAGARGIVRYDGTRVTVDHQDITEHFIAIWANESNDAIAVTSSGRVWRRTVTADPMNNDNALVVWVETFHFAGPVSAAWVRDRDDIYAVSSAGRIYHIEGHIDGPTRSDDHDADDNHVYRAIWGHGEQLIAVGDAGVIRRFDGTRWLPPETVPETADMAGAPALNSVWGSGLDNIFVVGDGGAAAHWNGRGWKRLDTRPSSNDPLYEPQRFVSVWSSRDNHVFALDTIAGIVERALWRYDGAEWALYRSTRGTSAMRAIWGAQPDRVHALSDEGAHLLYNGTSWTDQGLLGEAGQYRFNALWGDDAETLWAVGDRGVVFRKHVDGAWQNLESQLLASGVWPDGTPRDLLSVWGGSATDQVFVAGRAGTIIRYLPTADTWQRMSVERGDTPDFNAIWGRTADELFAVCQSGDIYEFDSDSAEWRQAWLNVPSTAPALHGLSGTDDVVYAIGDVRAGAARGTIMRRDATEWTQESELPAEAVNLHSVWVMGAGEVYVAGDQGALWHFNGAQWSPVRAFTQEPLRAVWSSGDAVVVGSEDGVLGTLTLPEGSVDP